MRTGPNIKLDCIVCLAFPQRHHSLNPGLTDAIQLTFKNKLHVYRDRAFVY